MTWAKGRKKKAEDTSLLGKLKSSTEKKETSEVVEEKKVAFPLLDKEGNIVFDKDGNPVIKKIKEFSYLKGFIQRKIAFPLPDWFNDSVTSSIIEKSEAALIREIDDLGFAIFSEMIMEPKIDYSEFLNWLYWVKASFCETSKGIGGAAVVHAKTTITKGENLVREYRQVEQMQQEEEAKKQKGLFGLGLGPL